MMKHKNKIMTAMLVCCLLPIMFMYCICIQYTNGLSNTIQKLGYTALCVFVVVVLYAVLYKNKDTFHRFRDAQLNKVFIALLAAISIVLFVISCLVKNVPVADYEYVYNSAMELLAGHEISWEYFSRCRNNVPLLYFYLLFGKLGLSIGFQDPYYFMLFINVLMVGVAAYAIAYIVSFYFPERKYLQAYAVLLFYGFLPLWGGTQALYTTPVSVMFGVLTISLFIKAKKSTAKYNFLAGATLVCGYLLHPCSIICVIAYLLVDLVKSGTKGLLGFGARTVIGALCIFVLFQAVDDKYANWGDRNNFQYPTLFWIAMGLQNDGSFEVNMDYVSRVYDAQDYEQREAIVEEAFYENFSNFYSYEHNKEKLLATFGDGTFGIYEFQYHVSLGYVLFNPYGEYGGIVASISTAYFYMIILFALLACLLNIYKKTQNPLQVMMLVSFTGFLVFMMLWESNSRQIYNQMAPLALLGAVSLDILLENCTIFTRILEKRH